MALVLVVPGERMIYLCCRMSRAWILLWWVGLFSAWKCNAEDIECLRSIKSSVKDPRGFLSSWNFSGSSSNAKGFICSFAGVECWHPDENRVLNIKLVNMRLEGQFPHGFQHCTTMTGLDLSGNRLSGTIPTTLSQWLPFLTSLDLSRNIFSGTIPAELANCSYLNVVFLQNNQLSGQIPWQLTRLERLKEFHVENNRLSGQIPDFLGRFNASSFLNNTGLCGFPLNRCSTEHGHGASFSSPLVLIMCLMAASTLLFLFVFAACWFFLRSKPQHPIQIDAQKQAQLTKQAKSIQVSVFDKQIDKIKLHDLLVATNGFSKDNIIASGRTGAMYRATLADGSLLTVKRLRPCAQTEKDFKMEMDLLGKLRHRNLVPLVGFCMAADERLLIYRHMINGSLYERLHASHRDRDRDIGLHLDWRSRLRIAIGAARGLAWLHHSCNPRIIHRNISSKCIHLDENLEARIIDYGLATLMNPADTHQSTFINGDLGDLGYVAPEYMSTLVATVKGDVYSFGVVLLELVTGQKPVAGSKHSFRGNLVEWLKHLCKNRSVTEALDKSLVGKGHDNELTQVLEIARGCVLSPPKDRPSMYEVYHLLGAVGKGKGKAKTYASAHQHENHDFSVVAGAVANDNEAIRIQ